MEAASCVTIGRVRRLTDRAIRYVSFVPQEDAAPITHAANAGFQK
jgi:hypothetical protein